MSEGLITLTDQVRATKILINHFIDSLEIMLAAGIVLKKHGKDERPKNKVNMKVKNFRNLLSSLKSAFKVPQGLLHQKAIAFVTSQPSLSFNFKFFFG